MQKLKRWVDYEIIMPLVMFVFAVTFYLDVRNKPRFGRLFPQLICIILIALLIYVLVKTIMKKFKEENVIAPEYPPAKQKLSKSIGMKRLIFTVMMFLYYIGIRLIGYMLATFVFMVASMAVLGYRKKLVIFMASVIFLSVVYAFFVGGFDFVLPQGSLLKLL